MPAVHPSQIDYWNAAAGETWARFQVQLDRQLAPLGAEAMRRLAPVEGEQVIDIGCGCGETSLALAERVGASGRIVGVDVSRPMLEVARRRPAPGLNVSFEEIDAQKGDLGCGGFDAAFSRFGVMFFEDPPAAFANLRAALRPGGRLAFVCWRPLAENPWMGVPLAAAAPFLPASAPPDPTAPGPFAFADPLRVRAILDKAGFAAVKIEPFDTDIGSGGVEDTLTLAFRLGPLGAALRETPAAADPAAGAVRAALEPHLTTAGVMMPAAVWIVSAQ